MAEKKWKKTLENIINKANIKGWLVGAGITLATITPNTFGQNATISGQAYDQDFQESYVPGTIVEAYMNNTLADIDTILNASGYKVNFLIDDVEFIKGLPNDYKLYNNFPNPFNPHTTIRFDTPRQGKAELDVFDLKGEKILEKNLDVTPGTYDVDINLEGKASGVYVYVLKVNDFVKTGKMVMIKGTNHNTSGFNKRFNKIQTMPVTLKFTREGYETDSLNLFINPGDSLTQQNIYLQQTGENKNTSIASNITKLPTNTPAQNVNIKFLSENNVLSEGQTNNNGEDTTSVPYKKFVDPLDTTNYFLNPSTIDINLSGPNYFETTDTGIPLTEEQMNYNGTIQQQLINKNGTLTGFVQNTNGEGLDSVSVVYLNNDDLTDTLGTTLTNNGDYNINFIYPGYIDDDNDDFSPLQNVKIEFTKPGYQDTNIVKSFIANDVVNMTMQELPPYIVNVTFDLNTTLKDLDILADSSIQEGRGVAGLDSVFIDWPDGSTTGYPNNNGIITIYKELPNGTDTAKAWLWHKHPEHYLPWFIGYEAVGPNNVGGFLFQNKHIYEKAGMPIQEVNNHENIQVYMVPRYSKWGANNELTIDMLSDDVTILFNRIPNPYVSGFRESPAGWNPLEVIQFSFNLDTNNPIPQNQLDRAFNELNKILTASHNRTRDLFHYNFTVIDSLTDPYLQNIINPPRSQDNFYYTAFYNGGPLNVVDIATDGTLRIHDAASVYNTGTTNGSIMDEMFASMTNTEFDVVSIVMQANGSFTDLGHNILGISYLYKPGTIYRENPPNKPTKENKKIILPKEYYTPSGYNYEYKEK